MPHPERTLPTTAATDKEMQQMQQHISKTWLRRSLMILTVATLGVAGCGQGAQEVDARSENAPSAPAIRYEGSADAIEASTAAGARYAGLSADAVDGWTAQDTYDGLSPDAVEAWTTGQ
jgi:hypothetical protein